MPAHARDPESQTARGSQARWRHIGAALGAIAAALTLAATASATFPGRNGVLLVAGPNSGGIASAGPGARTAECGYPWALWMLHPNGKQAGKGWRGNRGLFSPQGLRLASDYWGDPCWYYGNNTPDPSAGLSVFRLNGTWGREIVGDGLIGWLPDGRLIVWQKDKSGTERLLDPLHGIVIMTLPERDVDLSSDTGEFAMSCSARVALVRSSRSGYRLDVLTRTLVGTGAARRVRIVARTVARSRYGLSVPAWAPDGRTLVFSRQDQPGDAAQVSLWAVGVNGAGLHRLLNPSGAQDYGAKFSADGRRILFLRWHKSGEDFVPEDVVMNADGSGAKVLVTYPEDTDSVGNAVWSPDGKLIAINPYYGELWIVNSTSGAHRTFSFSGEALLDWQAVGGHPVRCADAGSAPIENPSSGLG